MYLINTQTAERLRAVIEPVISTDYKIIKKEKKRFPDFNWEIERKNEVIKIRLSDSDEILGLMSLIDFKEEMWLKINLLQTSEENVGRDKIYDRIAGCLIAYACRISFLKGYGGIVALVSKTYLVDHYVRKYGMGIGGRHLYTELQNSERLINEYLR